MSECAGEGCTHESHKHGKTSTLADVVKNAKEERQTGMATAHEANYGDDSPTKCENPKCFCHHWPQMNRHQRRAFKKTGHRE